MRARVHARDDRPSARLRGCPVPPGDFPPCDVPLVRTSCGAAVRARAERPARGGSDFLALKAAIVSSNSLIPCAMHRTRAELDPRSGGESCRPGLAPSPGPAHDDDDADALRA
ncbi:hypothetical protein SEVIR_5G227350v4 [Setaria viridis]